MAWVSSTQELLLAWVSSTQELLYGMGVQYTGAAVWHGCPVHRSCCMAWVSSTQELLLA